MRGRGDYIKHELYMIHANCLMREFSTIMARDRGFHESKTFHSPLGLANMQTFSLPTFERMKYFHPPLLHDIMPLHSTSIDTHMHI